MENLDVGQLIVWLVIGGFAGTLVGMILHRSRKGFGNVLMNVIIGLIGAIIGGFLFQLLNINFGDEIQFSFTIEDVVAAVVGSLILVVVVRLIRR